MQNTCKMCFHGNPGTHTLVNRFEVPVPVCTTCYHAAMLRSSHAVVALRTLVAAGV